MGLVLDWVLRYFKFYMPFTQILHAIYLSFLIAELIGIS